MYQTKDIAIVILNWNGKTLLEQFLPSITRFSEDALIYVADNASTDNSLAFVQEHFPGIKLIENDSNYGYAKGYNEALKSVEAPIRCLLNNDIEVTKDWLNPILAEFNLNTKTAIIQPKLLDYKRKSFFEYAGAAGGFIDKYGYPYCRGRVFDTIEEDTGQYNDTARIFWASGACLFIKGSVFEELDGFDASYFAHMEEIDLCWRAFNLGFDTKYVGSAEVYHVGGATLNNANPEKTYLNFRNSLYTLVKNTDKHVFSRTLMRMLLDGIAGLRFLVQFKLSHFLAILKAHGAFYMNLSRILNQRKSLKKGSQYYVVNSIIWSYFIKRQHQF